MKLKMDLSPTNSAFVLLLQKHKTDRAALSPWPVPREHLHKALSHGTHHCPPQATCELLSSWGSRHRAGRTEGRWSGSWLVLSWDRRDALLLLAYNFLFPQRPCCTDDSGVFLLGSDLSIKYTTPSVADSRAQ